MGKRRLPRKSKQKAVRWMRDLVVTRAQASRNLRLSPDLRPGPSTKTFACRNELLISQNRAAHNGADQPRQKLPTQGQR